MCLMFDPRLLLFLLMTSALSAAVAAVHGDVCVIEGSSWTEAPLQGGPHTSGTFDSFPNGASLDCMTCDPGWSRGLFANEHYILLGQRHIFIFGTTSCELHDSFDLNGQCSPKHIQRSLSEVNRYYIICQEGDRYQQLDYGDGRFSLKNERTHPSGAPLAIVKGTNVEDYLTEIDADENVIFFTQLSSKSPPISHLLGESDECVTPTGVNPTAPKSNGDPRVVVSCNGQNGENLRYVVTLGGNDPILIDAEGIPVHSPQGEYLLIVKQQGFVLYDTINYQQVYKSYNMTIDEIRFIKSGAGLFLSVAMATQPLRLVIVDEFFSSGGQSGEVAMDGTAMMCPGGMCLPHGVTGLDSELYYMFVQDEALITFLLFSLADLSLPPTRVRNINSQPDLALVFITPMPTPSISPSSEVSSTPPTPTPTPTSSSSSSSSPPPGTGGSPEPTPTPETEPTTDTPPTSSSPGNGGDTGGSGVPSLIVVIVVIVIFLIVIVLLIVCAMIIAMYCCVRRRSSCFDFLTKRPIQVSPGQRNEQFDPENSSSGNESDFNSGSDMNLSMDIEAGAPSGRGSRDNLPRVTVTPDMDGASNGRAMTGSGSATPSSGGDSGYPTQHATPVAPHKLEERLSHGQAAAVFSQMHPAQSRESLVIGSGTTLSPHATKTQQPRLSLPTPVGPVPATPGPNTGVQLQQVAERLELDTPSASAGAGELNTLSNETRSHEWIPLEPHLESSAT